MRKKIKSIFVVLIIVWFVISFVRLGNNILRTYTEERSLLYLTDDQKRTELFGDTHSILSLINNAIPNTSHIIILLPYPASDPRIEYWGIYYLYPRKIKFVKGNVKSSYIEKNDYAVLYFPTKQYQTIKTLESQFAHFKKIKEYTGKDYTAIVFYYE